MDLRRPSVAHVLPFAAWLGIMLLPWPAPAWNYLLRVVVAGGLFAALQPWRAYPPPRPRTWPAAAGTGLLVAVIWIGPETNTFRAAFPGAAAWYHATLFGTVADRPAPFAPVACGWGLTLVRWLGSALCIGVIEEFFWRGFAYRTLQDREFTRVPPGWHAVPFVVVTIAFGFEHARWLAGLAAGAAYGVLYIATRDIWSAVVAHAVTNALLGFYVLATGSYRFW